jgi:hypothetical protein
MSRYLCLCRFIDYINEKYPKIIKFIIRFAPIKAIEKTNDIQHQ